MKTYIFALYNTTGNLTRVGKVDAESPNDAIRTVREWYSAPHSQVNVYLENTVTHLRGTAQYRLEVKTDFKVETL